MGIRLSRSLGKPVEKPPHFSKGIENADDSGNGFEFIADEAVNVAETVVRRMMLDKLKSSLTLLSE